jgi:hypothetical protein
MEAAESETYHCYFRYIFANHILHEREARSSKKVPEIERERERARGAKEREREVMREQERLQSLMLVGERGAEEERDVSLGNDTWFGSDRSGTSGNPESLAVAMSFTFAYAPNELPVDIAGWRVHLWRLTHDCVCGLRWQLAQKLGSEPGGAYPSQAASGSAGGRHKRNGNAKNVLAAGCCVGARINYVRSPGNARSMVGVLLLGYWAPHLH